MSLDSDSQLAGEEAQIEEPKPQFDLTVSVDNMLAFLRVKPANADQVVTYDEVVDYLTQKGITYGICEDDIRDFCETRKFYTELLCAKGDLPVDGEDGSITYNFSTNTDFRPKERADGTVDFRDLDMVKNIAKGEELCRITPPVPGKDGTDVFNRTVPFKPGRSPLLPGGINTAVSEDGLALIAEVDGCINFTSSRIDVSEVFIVRGDVNSASGNINSIGSIIVQGDVREGFSVKAGKDISIHGMTEGAIIEAGGNITISNGMNGMGKGSLKAGGNIVGKYFENSILTAKGDIYADVLMNCRATAGGSIILKGNKASLIGGKYEAGQKIVAHNIGTGTSKATKVSIQSPKLNDLLVIGSEEESMEALEQQLTNAKNDLEDFQSKFADLRAQIRADNQMEPEKQSQMIKAAIIKKAKMADEVQNIKDKLKIAGEKKNSLSEFKIVGSSVVYIGTKMSIGPFNLTLMNDYSNMKFYANADEIVFSPVLPSDF